jgi:hypothetical protein
MTRLILVCVAMMLAGRAAHADGTALQNNAELVFNKFYLQDPDTGSFDEPIDEDQKRFYLNLAHCECSRLMLGQEQKVQYEITISAATGLNRPAEVYVGTECNDDTKRLTQCKKLETEGIANIDTLLTSPKRVTVSTFDLINPTSTMPATDKCKTVEQSVKIWLLVDGDSNGTFEYYKTIDVPTTTANAMTTEVKTVDTLTPPVPSNLRAQSGEESIQISWDAPDNTDAVYLYQALCMDEEGVPAASVNAQYQTTLEICGADPGITLNPIDSGGGAPVPEVPAEFKNLDTRFVCGEATQTATSLTIKGAKNGKSYRVALLVMDRYGNVAGSYFNQTVVPQPVTDLWEDLHDRDSAIDGGCLLSQTYGEGNPLTRVLRDFRDTTLARTGYGRALTHAYYATLGKLNVEGSIVLRILAGLYLLPLVIVALLWHALTLPGMIALFALLVFWRRLRIKRLVIALGLLAPSIASADDFEPYWETGEQQDASLVTIPEVDWHVGVKVGPYIPEIDLQAGLNAATGMGPYEAMFGDYYTVNDDGSLKKHEQRVWQVLPMLDVDRVLWQGFGQVTVGGSIGYMQKSAYAYVAGTSQDDEKRIRSTSGKNTFRLIPMAATVGYRFTYLDEAYGIPIVPYVRGGISYYAWWMKAPNGNLSKVCDADSPEGMCNNENKAYGGSFGFQGSVGLSVRAERIDSDAATSMRTSGLMHAGFYAELSYAKVDGFGSNSKLSVGDNTWFAGVDFEF